MNMDNLVREEEEHYHFWWPDVCLGCLYNEDQQEMTRSH
jgi:hypothetical protein